jgi:hypothetical protein
MRNFVVLGLASLVSVALTVAAVRADDKEENKADVSLKVSVPKEIKVKTATMPGGSTGEVKFKVTVKNTGSQPIEYSIHKLKINVLDPKGKPYFDKFWGWDKPPENLRDARLLEPGDSVEIEKKITFHTAKPDDGKYNLEVRIYGHVSKTPFQVKDE